MAPIRSSTSIWSEHSSQQVLVAGDALARDMLVSGIIDALLASGILVEEAQSSRESIPAHRRHVPSHRSRPDRVRRPPNSFILFRSDCVVELKKRLEGTVMRYDSKKFNVEVGRHWKSLSKAQQEPYKTLALEEAETHKLLYPDYKYKPNWEKTQRGRGKGKKNAEVGTVTVAPEAAFAPYIHPPLMTSEPAFTITAPVLTVSVPDVYACASSPSHPGPVFQYNFADGTPMPYIFKDDPLVNFRGAVDPNIMLSSSLDSLVADSSSSHRLEQGPSDFGCLGDESPGPVPWKYDLNELFDMDAFFKGLNDVPVRDF
ncbi:hypothetical protein ARMSODRAFT_126615 [Armillaria solidipes]|uniref:HMG box domain-containing protein n=1 Tax=Armillaria solidipes TaxID=1076256 RepID=A0A2H3BMJ1_9AGAR|nr:hypothetical protein ARMSODRAFT_126615 [Armillaria solidipes]